MFKKWFSRKYQKHPMIYDIYSQKFRRYLCQPCIAFHACCMDGLAASALFHKKYPSATSHPHRHGKPEQLMQWLKGELERGTDIFYFVDICPSPSVLSLLTGKIVVVIDHHKDACERLAKNEGTVRIEVESPPITQPGVFLFYEDGIAATELVWRYLYGMKHIPLALRLISAADLHDRSKHTWTEFTGFTIQVKHYLNWDKIATWSPEKYLDKGRKLLELCYDETHTRSVLKEGVKQLLQLMRLAKDYVEEFARLPRGKYAIVFVPSTDAIDRKLINEVVLGLYPHADFLINYRLKERKVYLKLKLDAKGGVSVDLRTKEEEPCVSVALRLLYRGKARNLNCSSIMQMWMKDDKPKGHPQAAGGAFHFLSEGELTRARKDLLWWLMRQVS